MIYHNIVWFNISMNYLDNLMTVLKCFKHINEIQSSFIWVKSHSDNFSNPTFNSTLFVIIFVLKVLQIDFIIETSSFIILSDDVQLFLIRIIDDFCEPHNVWMVQSLKHLHLFKYTIISCLSIQLWHAHQLFFIHLFYCIMITSL